MSVVMSTENDISEQQALLHSHRRTLFHYLQQQAIHSSGYTPPNITHGIREARDNIKRIKGVLRGFDADIEDHSDDYDNIGEHIKSLEQQLRSHYMTLQLLEEQKAQHEALNIPLDLWKSISREKDIIARIEWKLLHIKGSVNITNQEQYSENPLTNGTPYNAARLSLTDLKISNARDLLFVIPRLIVSIVRLIIVIIIIVFLLALLYIAGPGYVDDIFKLVPTLCKFVPRPC